MLEDLKQEVLEANLELVTHGLVTLTWGNVSGICRSEGIVAIKPSGVDYASLTVSDIVLIDMDGRIVEGRLRPSSDTPTHLALFQAFPEIGGVTHTHSMFATVFAQASRQIPCLGTTHADHFFGSIPVTRLLTEEEVTVEYEKNTGKVIVERFAGIDPSAMPGVLVAGHAPFCWGKNAMASVHSSLILERVAGMAYHTLQLTPGVSALPDYFIEKHYNRKHGPNAYYGQQP
ncbi:MAG TPA: L-ribulose-5-phosphate 4-epimerase AraD [Bacteroidota bacterium]|nr:L-ribulose-5-phosphate 4-epimerase AraD [Bacteroidota bacterium]